MRAARRQRLALALRLYFQIADAGLLFQQLQLRVAELFAAGTVLLNPLQPQPLFQYLDLEVAQLQLPLQLDYFGRVVGSGLGGLGIATGKNNYRGLCFLSHEKFLRCAE